MWPFGSSKPEPGTPTTMNPTPQGNAVCMSSLKAAIEEAAGNGARAFQVANVATENAGKLGVQCNIKDSTVTKVRDGQGR